MKSTVLDIGLMVLLSTVILQKSVDTAEKLVNEMMVTELCASLSTRVSQTHLNICKPIHNKILNTLIQASKTLKQRMSHTSSSLLL